MIEPQTEKASYNVLLTSFGSVKISWHVLKEKLHYDSYQKICLIKNSSLALMHNQTLLNTLQISFLLISQQSCITGTIISIKKQTKKKKLGVQEI